MVCIIHINAPEGCRFVLSFHGHLCQARPDFIDIRRPGIQPETDSLVSILIVLGRRPRLRPIVAAAGPLGEAVEGSPLRLLPRAHGRTSSAGCCRLRRRPRGAGRRRRLCLLTVRAVREAVRVRLVRRIGHMQRHAVALVRAHREDLTCQCQGGALAPHRALCAEGWQEPHLAPSSTGRSSASFSSCTRCTSSAIFPPSHGNMYSLGTITGNPGGHSKGGGVGARCRGPGVRRA